MAEHVERREVREISDDKPETVSGPTLAARIITFLTGILLILLAFRFVLALLGANPGNAFASFIYDASRPFVSPFFSLFNYDLQEGASRFELYTLVAMAVYAFVGWGLASLTTIGKRET